MDVVRRPTSDTRIWVRAPLTKTMPKRGRSYSTKRRYAKKRRTTALPFKKRRLSRNVRTGGFLDMEVKFKDFRVNDDAFTQVWAGGEMEDATALSVSAVAQGDGESERDGRVYWIKSIFIHGTIEQPQTEAQGQPLDDQVVRLALVWDKQTNGAQLNAEDVFLTIASGDDIDSFRNLQFTKRFQVLADQKHLMQIGRTNTNEGAVNAFASAGVTKNFKFSHIFRTPIKVTCKGTTAVIASIVDNSLHIIGTGTAAGTTLSYASRLRFTG